MNERIKELYRQSLKEVFEYGGADAKPGEMYSNHKTVLDHDKFAQLIIRDCKDLLFESSENNRLPIAVDDMVHIIDTHFGVEL